MDARKTKQVIISQVAPAGDAGIDGDESLSLPPDFANRAGWLAHINEVTMREVPEQYPGVDVASIINKPGGIREKILNMKGVRPNEGDFQTALNTLSGRNVNEMDIMGLRVIVNNPFEGYNQDEAEAARSQIEGYAINGGPASAEVKRIVNADTQFRNELNRMKALSTQRGIPVAPVAASETRVRTVTAQDAQALPPDQGVLNPEVPDSDPLSVDKFESIEQLRQVLVRLGPKKETYDKLFDLVGPGSEDSAKSALAKFFEGSPGALCVLYDLLVRAGVASPIDQATIGELMSAHPDIFPNDETVASGTVTLKHSSSGGYVLSHDDGRTLTVKNEWDYPDVAKAFGWKEAGDYEAAKTFLDSCVGAKAPAGWVSTGQMFGDKHESVKASVKGLYLPPCDSGLRTITAGGGVGGTIPQNYSMHGPSDTRHCPKIRNMVSTFICRYHCLDGLLIDDHQVLCGEAIWRQSIMDKFSREYKDADGNWVGGYINKRFEVDRTTHEHPYQLKPGQRHAPINEDAWSVEKRLQEMRRDESDDRGYSDTPGDPEGLYNFDQHDLTKGPKAPGLSGKDKDSISKLASTNVVESSSMFRKAGDPRFEGFEWAVPEPVEATEFHNGGDDTQAQISGMYEQARQQRLQGNIAAAMAIEEEAERLVSEVKSAQPMMGPQVEDLATEESSRIASASRKFNFVKKANMAPPLGGSHAMGDYDKVGQRAVRCSNPNCRKISKMGLDACPNCGSRTEPYHMSEIMNETGAMPKAPAMAMLANGVYRVDKDGQSFFGDTLYEAQFKADIVPMEPMSVQEEADVLENIIQEDTGLPQQQAAPVDTQAPDPALEDRFWYKPPPEMLEDDEGGIEEDLGLVDASDLDEQLAQDAASEEPEARSERTEEFASYGLDAETNGA